jgi:uncharacterized protein YgbK (DUF1537 family)
MLLGCIGDDFTGSGDLGNTLRKAGMRVSLFNGTPQDTPDSGIDAGVIALKSRSTPVAEAVVESLAALDWLILQGCQQFFFKYCSTFDSTPAGNIGPVAEALARKLGAKTVLFCPSFPTNGRTVYQGHLFVQDRLISESGMARHPLTPMTDPDLRRWLGRQASVPVELLPYKIVEQGQEAIRSHLDAFTGELTFVIADALTDRNLMDIGKASRSDILITGGSGVALGLPANFGIATSNAQNWVGQSGRGVVLSGSCSDATRGQIAEFTKENPFLELDVEDIANGRLNTDPVIAWVLEQSKAPLILSSADPVKVRTLQDQYGPSLAEQIERFFGALAVSLAANGFSRIVVAGGETSGAVVKALDPPELLIGPEIDSGVPALTVANRPLVLALKSGNFGGRDFFAKALEFLESTNDH